MKEKVLITGASGFIGSHIVEAALNAGLEVHAAVRKSSRIDHLKHYPIHFIYPDFANIDSLRKDIDQHQYSYIIHAAGLTKAQSQPEYDLVNADYTYNLARAAEQAAMPIKKMVFYSSLAAIGPLNNIHDIITEATPPNPLTGYGKSKLLAEQKLANVSLPLITLRPTAVYGPRERDLFIMIKSFNRGLEPYIGRSEQQLSFVYGKDLAELSVKALFAAPQLATYNITDGRYYGRYDLAIIAKRILQKNTFKFHVPLGIVKIIASSLETTYGWMGKMPTLYKARLQELTAVNWNCDIQKARTELGYVPLYDLEKGMRETIDWYKAERWIK